VRTDAELRRLGAYDEIIEAAMEQEERRCKRMIGPYPCCTVVQGDCLELMKAIPDGAIDNIVVDPPYPKEYLDSLAAAWPLCRKAARDGAWLLVLSGQVWLPRVMDDIEVAGWKYRWIGNFRMPMANSPIWPIGISTGWKPLLIYGTDAKQKFAPWKYDVFENATQNGDDKQYHEWGQSFRQFVTLLERFEVGGTILDPFCGSGTTLVAAKKLGRHFLGFEISAEYCAIARRRLAEIDAQPQLPFAKPEQMRLEP